MSTAGPDISGKKLGQLYGQKGWRSLLKETHPKGEVMIKDNRIIEIVFFFPFFFLEVLFFKGGFICALTMVLILLPPRLTHRVSQH